MLYTRTSTYQNEVIFFVKPLQKQESQSEKLVNAYRFGFNGKEMDNEVKGVGNQYDYGFRIYDPRIAKFLSVDPLFKEYPWYTPYQFAGNKPIWAIDMDGAEEYYASSGELIGKYGTNTEIRIVYDKYIEAAKNITSNKINTKETDVMNNVLYNRGSAGIFTNTDDLAINWGERYNAGSIKSGKENSSFIFYTRIDKKIAFSYTEPKEGGISSVTNTIIIGPGMHIITDIHSHANFDIKFENDQFSDTWTDKLGVHDGDIGGYKKNDFPFGYLTTPNGSVMKWNKYSDIETIGCDIPSDSKHPNSKEASQNAIDSSISIIK